jgi:hypothetical protein
MMGDIVQSSDMTVRFMIDLIASAPIEKVELRNGLEVLETIRPYTAADLGNRLRVVWSGAEYHGRGRETIWDGQATVTGNTIRSACPINFYNLEKTLRQTSPTTLTWQALTTGGWSGFDCVLTERHGGSLSVTTSLVQFTGPLDDIGLQEQVYDAGGLARQVRVSRLPDVNPHTHLTLERTISLRATGDNPLYICVTQEDGHLAWSSPIYIFQ